MPVSEIGSDFPLPLGAMLGPRLRAGGPSAEKSALLLGSGRDALHWVIRSLGLPAGAEALLPAYLCDSVLQPFLAHGLRVRFYGITGDLQPDAQDLLGKLTPDTRVLLYIHYFGFPLALPAAVAEAASPEAVIIEDSSHAFLSRLDHPPVRGHIQFASYRKLLPLPNGAIVSWDASRLPGLDPARTRFSTGCLGAVACRCAGGALKALWLRQPGIYPKGLFRRFFAWSDALLEAYPKPAGMSLISRHLLDRLDLEQVVRIRRRNFQYLLDNLGPSDRLRPLYASLPEGVCPLGFPVLSSDRDALARYLIERRVYSPVHWQLPDAVDRSEFPDAWDTSDHILTIPIDQRYSEEDMAHVARLIESYQRRQQKEESPWPVGC